MGFTWLLQGVKELLAGLFKSEARGQALLQAKLQAMGSAILAESLVLVPRDTGELADSAFMNRDGLALEIGYSAPHALIVHELPPDRASHAPPTQYKFLELPARRHFDNADKDLQDLDPFAGQSWWGGR